jgi:hypothetical protein
MSSQFHVDNVDFHATAKGAGEFAQRINRRNAET